MQNIHKRLVSTIYKEFSQLDNEARQLKLGKDLNRHFVKK